MKAALAIIFLLTATVSAGFAQITPKRYQEPSKIMSASAANEQVAEYDFSGLFTHTDNSSVYGFIGVNKQRIHIKFISVTKDIISPAIYNVCGKSMVKNNIFEFTGTIKITKILKLNITRHGCEDGYKYKGFKGEYAILGEYIFAEDKNQKYSGIFKGIFRSDYFISKNNQVQYDDIENCADEYTNNQFAGKWTNYNGTLTETCNWGDFRIPNSGDLDDGAAEFSPFDTYLKYGWQSRRDYFLQSGPNYKKAKQIEEAKWWQ